MHFQDYYIAVANAFATHQKNLNPENKCDWFYISLLLVGCHWLLQLKISDQGTHQHHSKSAPTSGGVKWKNTQEIYPQKRSRCPLIDQRVLWRELLLYLFVEATTALAWLLLWEETSASFLQDVLLLDVGVQQHLLHLVRQIPRETLVLPHAVVGLDLGLSRPDRCPLWHGARCWAAVLLFTIFISSSLLIRCTHRWSYSTHFSTWMSYQYNVDAWFCIMSGVYIQ